MIGADAFLAGDRKHRDIQLLFDQRTDLISACVGGPVISRTRRRDSWASHGFNISRPTFERRSLFVPRKRVPQMAEEDRFSPLKQSGRSVEFGIGFSHEQEWNERKDAIGPTEVPESFESCAGEGALNEYEMVDFLAISQSVDRPDRSAPVMTYDCDL